MRKQLKRWLAAVLCAALLLPSMARAAETMEGTVATFSEEGNLTAYGSFEADQVITDTTDPNYAVLQDVKLAGKTMADFWPQGRTYPVYYEADSSNGKGSVVFTYDTENKVEGNQSLRITMAGANRYIIFRATGPLTSGTKYRVSYRYKTETLSTTATNNSYVPLIRREFADSAWTVVAADRVLIGNLATGTNNWQQITQEFTTPASGRPNFQLVLQVANHAAGNLTTGILWLDDLRLEEVVPPVAVSLDKTSLALKTGETSQLTATVTNAADSAVTWTSSDAAVASVSAAGLVAAVAAGNATITANSVQDSTKSAVCTVNVTAPPEPGVTKLRVGTFNIAAVKKLPIAAQAALVDANQIDLVGLQEVDVNTTRRPTDMLADFAAAGSLKNIYFQKAIDMTDGHGVYGIGIASKLPLTGTGGASLYSETGAEGRAYARAVVTVEGKQIAIYNTHLSWESNVALATRLRGEQIKQIIAEVKADPTPYKVITGDFNIDQTRGEWYPFLEEFNMANGGDGTWYPTFNGVDSTMKVMDIDNIITTRNIKVENVTMVDTKTANVSDHNLLYADLTLLDQEQPSKQLLNLLVGDAEKLAADDYTTASFAAVTTAVNAAKALAADADQTVIDTAVATLRAAVTALVSNPNKEVNLALNRPVTVSSEESGKSNFARNMTDGDMATRWAAGDSSYPQQALIDLGQTCDITKFETTFFNSSTARSYQYKIFTSLNGKDYTELVNRSANTTRDLVVDTAAAGTQARFVRVDFSGASVSTASASIYELKVFGPSVPALPGSKENLALNKTVTVSGLEVTDGRLTGPMAVDGSISATSRWSPNKDTTKRDFDAWLAVDLGTLRTVQQIDIKFESEAHQYEVLVSEDGVNYTLVAAASPTTEGETVNKSFFLPEAKIVRYVKYHQTQQWKHANGKYYGGSIYELEVYQEPLVPQGAAGVLADIQGVAPTVSADGKTLVLPASPNPAYTVSLYGSDNQQVVALDGTVHKPLVDMPVNVLYKVTNIENAQDFVVSEADIKFTVTGQTTPQQGDNAKPNVVPGLREWKGGTGDFVLTGTSAIVLDAVSASELAETAQMIQKYFKDMLGRDIVVRAGAPAAGDVFLTLDPTLVYLGGEGYTLVADDVLTISSRVTKGVLYGGISLTQVFYQETTHTKFPKGTAHDYPKYEVRSGMLDVGRMYIPLEYVQEMALYMAWFKLNNIQMHINDYWGNSGYSAFRLESTTYPAIVAKDGYYTKDAYKQFQKDVAKYGIEVVTEIDSPYHAESFRAIEGAPMKAAGQLDIRTEETYVKSIKIIKDLMDEYLDGPDPVFQGNKYHIGTDEYDKGASEMMRKFTDELIKYSNTKGRETRVWASLGQYGFKGTTPVTNQATMNLWAPYWAGVKETYAAGYDVINTDGGWLYIVPRGNANYPDRLNLADRYNNFEVNNISSPRSLSMGGAPAIMPFAHPQTKGAQFCVWNDMTSFRGGYSEFDVYDRFKNAVALVSEKTWYGEKSEGQTGAQFEARFAAVGTRAPGSNAGRFVETKTDLMADIDFTDGVKDATANGYHGALTGGAVVGKGGDSNILKLDGTGALSLPMGSVGYPYTVKLDIKLDADTPVNTLLFSGKDGEFYANVDGTGHPGFKRSYHPGTQNVGYTFVFTDVTLPTDRWISIALTCNQSNVTLYLDGKAQTRSSMTTASRNNGFGQQPTSYNDSTTFILPVEEIGKNMKGELAGLKLYNRVLTPAEIAALVPNAPVDPNVPVNLALGKTATASSTYPGKSWTPDKAVDGINDYDTTKDSRWSSKRATGQGTNEDTGEHGTAQQWITVDLGQTYKLDKVTIFWEGAFATHYKLMGSLDNVAWTEVKDVNASAAGLHTHDGLGGVSVRYLKVDCLTPKTANYGYSIFELEVYEAPNTTPIAGSVSVTGAAVFGSALIADTANVTPAEAKAGLTYQWYRGTGAITGATGSTYQLVGADVGQTVKVTVTGTGSHSGSLTSAPTAAVAKADQAAPQNVRATNCTTADNNDGMILNVTAAMEYKLESAGQWTGITGTTVTGLASGTYQVRYATTGTHNASVSISVTILGYSEPPKATTKTEAKKNEDGSTTRIVTDLKTGAVTETTAWPDGTKLVTVTDKDGVSRNEVTMPKDKESVTVTIPMGRRLKPGEVAVIMRPDGTKEIVKTSVAAEDGIRVTLTEEGVLEIIDNSKRFIDVETKDWFDASVQFVASRELFNGTGANTFSPDAPTSRAMLMTVLARLNGADTSQGETWYSAGMEWAVVNGVSDGTNPEGSITREQLALMLYRYAGAEKTGGDLGKFSDAGEVSAWAAEAMAWAVETGIIQGSAGRLSPTAAATRAEVAVMLERFIAHQILHKGQHIERVDLPL